MRHHHHLVAQPLHLLHDVGGKDDALALLVAQPAQRVAQARVASTSRPLVGSSSTMLAGSCTSARASAVFMRSPWLKPSVRRSSSGSHVQHRARLRRAPRGRRRHAVQAAVVDDVLARRQARVQAARVAEHAHARQRLPRLRGPRRCRPPHMAGVGPRSAPRQCAGGGLARAVGAQQAGDAAVGGGEAHAVHGLHRAPCGPRPWVKRLLSCALRSWRARFGPQGAALGGGLHRHKGRRARNGSWRSRRRPSAPRRRCRRRQSEQRVAHAADAHHAVPGLRHHHMPGLGAQRLGTRAPWRGGVTGSAPPDSTSVAAGAAGRCRRPPARRPRPAAQTFAVHVRGRVAEVGTRPVGRGARRGRSSAQTTEKCMPSAMLHRGARRPAPRSGPQRLRSGRAPPRSRPGQRRRQRRRVQRAAHHAQQHVACQLQRSTGRSPGAPPHLRGRLASRACQSPAQAG
jgi:hypothetical protein